jgi:saccharopine dehydrogenase (NAD+, L-lysine-forming)
MAIIGIIRESKKPYDKRVALSPAQCVDVMNSFTDVKILVQPSPHRCISDAEYLEAGIEMSENLEHCDILLGIKEVPIEDLIANKTYLFFSHTIKKQPHNRKLLRTVLQKNIRLVDYETLVWENGSRVLGFGRFAGIVGTHNAFLTWGEKFNLFKLKPAYLCENYAEMKAEYDKIEMPPLKIALCGDGRVAHGCLELLNLLHVREVTPQEFLDEQFDVPTYVHLVTEDFYAHKDGELWDKADFYHNPENYISTFKQYTQHCDVMLNAIFWNERIPRFFSKEDMKARDFKIKVIADISCDVNGSIPATMKDTTIEDPVFGYHPLSETIEAPFLKNTIDIMAVSNLPCELPYDASVAFGEQLIKHVIGNLLNANNSRMIQFATIAQNGELTERYNYLKDYVE